MYELVQISEKCYYINCPAKIGVYVADKDNVYLIDSVYKISGIGAILPLWGLSVQGFTA